MKKQNRKLSGARRAALDVSFAFIPICRPSTRPKAALDALEQLGIADVSMENRLEVRADGDMAELLIIGAIGKSWWDDSGITEQEVRDALKSIPSGKKITAKINSEGGSVKEGLGIYNAFKERSGDITACITGYALSIASIFPLGAGKVVSPKSAIWMIHEAWSFAQGNKHEMRRSADMLEIHDETMVDIYCAETGKTKEEIRSAMENETWIKGSAAVEFGLADETDEEVDESQAGYRPLHPDFITRCRNISPEILNAIQPKSGKVADNSAALEAGGQPQKQTPPAVAVQHQENTMNKKILVALLFEHGIKDAAGKDLTEQSSDTDFEVALKTLAKKPGMTDDTRMKAIEARQELAETRRITDKVLTYVQAGKITNAEAPIFVSAARGDEAGTFRILDEKEGSMAGGSPIGFSGIQIVGGGNDTDSCGPKTPMLTNIHKDHKTPKARHAALLGCYDSALREAGRMDARSNRRGEVFGSNTYTGTIITNFLMDGSITDLQNMWAFLSAYSLVKDVDPYKPLATGQLKHVTVGETTQVATTAPESFEPVDGSTVTNIQVAMNWFNQPMRVGANDLNSGLRMQDLMTLNLAKFANTVTEYATAPITAANFTATPVICAAAAFGYSELALLQGQLQKSPIKNLILDGTYLARIANQPGFFQKTGEGLDSNGGYAAYGWNGIFHASDWTGAGANIKGFACNPQAIVRATGLPLNPPDVPGGVFQTRSIELPGIGIAVAFSQWFSLATRTMMFSWDLIGGFAAADKTAGVVVASGTPS
jgi:ATP-dependent protease ClpP protease subunit